MQILRHNLCLSLRLIFCQKSGEAQGEAETFCLMLCLMSASPSIGGRNDLEIGLKPIPWYLLLLPLTRSDHDVRQLGLDASSRRSAA